MSKAKQMYQIKVTLRGSKPPIWRRVVVASDTTLLELHQIIQAAMGWYNSHLHMFVINGEQYSTPSPYGPDYLAELGAKSAKGVKLNKLISGEGAKFIYEYDFGDSWEHVVLVEKVLPMIPDFDHKLPVCIMGKRACPPEDVGGIWGYENFLEAMKDPSHEEHESFLEWVGGEFDPEAFDLDMVNRRLKR
jgi:hypothetical protein